MRGGKRGGELAVGRRYVIVKGFLQVLKLRTKETKRTIKKLMNCTNMKTGRTNSKKPTCFLVLGFPHKQKKHGFIDCLFSQGTRGTLRQPEQLEETKSQHDCISLN